MIVIDSSVLIKFVIPEARNDLAIRLASDELIAPSIWMAEAANALSRKVRMKEFDIVTAQALMEQLLKAPVLTFDIAGYVESALDLSAALSHPVYDCMFLALAVREDCTVVTDDQGFAKAVRRHPVFAPRIKLLSET